MAGLLTCGYALGQLACPMLSALSSWWIGQLEPALLASLLALAVAGLLAGLESAIARYVRAIQLS